MLVLERRLNETILIGDDIAITVVRVRGDNVKLGVIAPKHVSVHRKEVFERIKLEGRIHVPTLIAGEQPASALNRGRP